MREAIVGPESPLIVRYRRDHVRIDSETCGALVEILAGETVSPTIALARDIRTTVPRFHQHFEEVYFMLEGAIDLRLFDPTSNAFTNLTLGEHEVCVIPRGIHHQVVRSSLSNLLCALSVPRFDRNDEHLSDVAGWEPTLPRAIH